MNVSIGTRISQRLAELGMTQSELGKLVGITQVMVHKLINGEVKSPTKILEIADALQCDPYWLKFNKEGRYASRSRDCYTEEWQYHLITKIAGLSEFDRGQVVGYVNGLADKQNKTGIKKTPSTIMV